MEDDNHCVYWYYSVGASVTMTATKLLPLFIPKTEGRNKMYNSKLKC